MVLGNDFKAEKLDQKMRNGDMDLMDYESIHKLTKNIS